MPLKEADKLVINGSHAGVHFQSERIPVFNPALQSAARQSAGPEIDEKRRRFYFILIGIEDYFSNRFGFLFCFLRIHFDMFGHGFMPFRVWRILLKTLSRTTRWLSTSLVVLCSASICWSQTDRAIISHNSESITILPIVYGIEKGFYRAEGVNMDFRFLRADLAAAAIASSQEVDYMISTGTAFRAAVRGLPLKIVAYSFNQPLFYLMTQSSIHAVKELKGKKIAVSSPQDTGGLAAKAALRAAGLDPERDVFYISIGAASVRIAAMEVGSIEAAIMPVPWNRSGFNQLVFAGGLLPQPLTGIVTSAAKLEKAPEQVKKVLRAYLRSIRRLRQDKADAVDSLAAALVWTAKQRKRSTRLCSTP